MLTDPERGFDRELFFVDRRDAGVALAAALQRFRSSDVVVLGLPRGGVPVAAEVARRLDVELDVIVARKLGSPDAPELAIGAITADGERVLNEDVMGLLGVSPAYLETVSSAQQAEARRRETRFRSGRPAPRITGRTVILVDDGLATGATMRAAVRAVRKWRPSRLVVAVPVGSPDACRALRAEADEVVSLGEPEYFTAVGSFYRDFRQVEDTEVQRLLEERAAATAV